MQMIDTQVFELPGARGAMALLLACALADACTAAGQAWALAQAIVGLWEGLPLSALVPWIAVFAGCYAARQLIAYGRSSCMERYACECANTLRQELAEHIYEGGPAFVQAHGTGNVVTTLVNGVDQAQAYVELILPKLADLLVVPLVLTAVLFALDWVSGLIALTVFPCTVLFMRLLGATAKEAAARQHGTYRRLANHFIDTLRGMGTLKVFGQTGRQGERVFATSEKFRGATMATLRVATLSSLVLDLWGTFALAAVAIMLGFRLLNGSMAFVNALAALIIVPEFFGAVRRFAADFHASLDGRNALASIRSLLDAVPSQVCEVAARPWSASSTLSLRDVSHFYAGEAAKALSAVNLSLKGCVRVAIVGASGAGKSTLAQVLAGFVPPTSGGVVWDGREMAGLACDAWCGQVAYLPQAPRILSASLRDNIALYRPDASDAEVEAAARAAGLGALMDQLPLGLLTLVGEGGRGLSGGQAQRVALARVFLDDRRRVLVFDEPTAHLDIETELALKERMLALMEGRLVVFATHRLHWLNAMDLVVVLDQGRVVQVGRAHDLLADGNGALARLVAQQRGEGC